MFLFILALFIIVPLLELWLIIQIGSAAGYLPTFAALVLVSVAGAALAKQQGYQAALRIQEEIRQGRMPGNALLDGFLVLAGALLLLTPGFLTDAAGLAVILPLTRRPFRAWLEKRLRQAVERRTMGTIVFWPGGGRGARYGGQAGEPERPYNSGDGAAEPERHRKGLER
ncbi:MAG: FxsA family protein [Thermoleophilia bacterium]|nr:FxsA family protein [Thermoleophilia bacterium]